MPRHPSRKKIFKKPEKFLIITEGQLTEVKYLRSFARELGIIKKVHIPSRNSHSAPISIFKIARAENEKQKYEKVFCVIDRDSHKNFNDAIAKMKGKGFEVIISNPCIEYWFLLHYTSSTHSFSREGKKSPADMCISALKKHIPNYEKNMEGLCKTLEGKVSDAKKNAKATIKAVGKHGNPSTEVHLLIKELEDLSKEI